MATGMTQQGNKTARAIRGSARIVRLLCSRPFVAVLLGLLLGVCMAGVFIPQQGAPAYPQWRSDHPALAYLAAGLRLDRAFTSPPFLAVVGLAGLSVTLSVLTRLNDLRQRRRGRGLVRELLARRPLLGSLIFHAGLVGILAAAVTSALTRSEGMIVLTEGQVNALDSATLSSVEAPRLALKTSAPFQVRLDKFHPIHEGRFGTPDYASDLTVIEDGQEVLNTTVRVNEPLVHRGVTLYQQFHGFSPLFTLSDATGRQRFSSFVSFNSEVETEHESDPVRYRDDFTIPGTNLSIEAELFPDAFMLGNQLASHSPDPKNPAMAVIVRDGVETIFNGPVYLGQVVELGSGLRLAFGGLRYWSGFNTVRDQGSGALFVSAWAAVIGLCLRFMPRMKLRAAGRAQ